MSVVINNNLNALNAARTLNGHYGRLAKSVQRLSSGLRVNSAADDAAGLAIREMMRADIAAMQQGTRNANDAISMIQTADGAMAVIDEKLIRMKELAEQAATGTYNSTQRLIIDSEFQAMGAEIERIARATDFNGLKILDGNGVAGRAADGRTATGRAAGAAAGSRASVVGPDGKTYSATVGETKVGNGAITTQNPSNVLLQGITDPVALGAGTHTITLSNSSSITVGSTGQYKMNITYFGNNPAFLNQTLTIGYNPANAADPDTQGWELAGFPPGSYEVAGNPSSGRFTFTDLAGTLGGQSFRVNVTDTNGNPVNLTEAVNFNWQTVSNAQPAFDVNINSPSLTAGNVAVTSSFDPATRSVTMSVDLGNGNVLNQVFNLASGNSEIGRAHV